MRASKIHFHAIAMGTMGVITGRKQMAWYAAVNRSFPASRTATPVPRHDGQGDHGHGEERRVPERQQEVLILEELPVVRQADPGLRRPDEVPVVEGEAEGPADRLEPQHPVDREHRQEAEVAEAVLREGQTVQAERGRGLDAALRRPVSARAAGRASVTVERREESYSVP